MAHPMSRKSLWRVLQWLAVLLILFFWGRVVRNNWSVLTGYPWHISPTWLALSLVILGTQALLLATLWRRLLALCGEALPRRQGDALWLQSQLARYLPGGVWEVATRVLMGRRLGIGALVMSAVYGLELALQILSAGVFFGAALALRSERPPTSYLVLIGVLVLASLLILLPPIFNPLVCWGLRVLRRPAVPVQVTYRASLGLFAAYMLAHALSGLGFVFFLRGVGPPAVVRSAPTRPGLRGRLAGRAGGDYCPHRHRCARGRVGTAPRQPIPSRCGCNPGARFSAFDCAARSDHGPLRQMAGPAPLPSGGFCRTRNLWKRDR